MFSLKPDFIEAQKRFEAFWACDVTDRPLVTNITFPVDNPVPVPQKRYDTLKDKWLDIDFRVKEISTNLHNKMFYADTLPIAKTNFGPEIFSAWCGCSYNFGETTAWSDPCVHDWEKDYDKAVLNMDHPLFRLLEDFTNKLLVEGKGHFITAMTDFHVGGDHLAALRDPSNLAMDMIENPDYVKRKLEDSQQEYFKVYDHFYNIIRSHNVPITTWMPLVSNEKYYVVSNDFSCMVSNKMFEEFFLDGIINECRFLDKSMYHLDGQSALRHLDMLLSIKELNGVQWVPGAGNEGFERWIPVYQKIQRAGKSIFIDGIDLSNIHLLFENLRPEGVWISGLKSISSKEEADYALKRITNWK